MRIEPPKKKDKNAQKWEEHMEKKSKGPKVDDSEIIRPVKKAPNMGKPSEGRAAKVARSGQTLGKIASEAKKEMKGAQIGSMGKGTALEGIEKSVAGEQEILEGAGREDSAMKEIAQEAKKKKVKQKSRKVLLKNEQAAALRDSLHVKVHLPTFRGRFGKRSIRRKSIAKWDKWRVPRGIDIKRVMSDGYMPRVGFATPKDIRHVHPSGYREFTVNTLSQIESIPAGHAMRVAGGIGKRKKIVIVGKAIEKGIKVLNP